MKYINILHYFLTIGLIITVCILLLNQNKIQNQLSDGSVVEQISYPFEERNMTLVLTLIGVGFGLFALFTFGGVKQLFDAKVEEVNERYNKAKQEYDSHREKLNELKKDLHFVTATMLHEHADESRKEGLNGQYALMMMSVLEHHCEILELCDNGERRFAVTKFLVSRDLESAIKSIEEYEKPILIKDIDPVVFKERIERISKNLDANESHLLYQLASSFKIHS